MRTRCHSPLLLPLLAVVAVTTACKGDEEEIPKVAVAVEVTGLAGALTLSLNGGAPLVVIQDGRHTFSEGLPQGQAYLVKVVDQPVDQRCTASDEYGMGDGDVTVKVLCEDLLAGFSVGGIITGASGELVLRNNGADDLTVGGDGAFKFATRLDDGAAYDVTVVTHPQGQDCRVSEGAGNISGRNVTSIQITCHALRYQMVERGFGTEAPSVVKAIFHVYDAVTGAPVTDLEPTDFLVLEDDVEITPKEAFLDLVRAGEIQSSLRTVLMLDVSQSISPEDLETAKQTAKALVADPDTGESRLLPGQQLAVYTFDDYVQQRRSFTSDVTQLLSAIDAISSGGPSTNLYGALLTGVNATKDLFSLEYAQMGAVVVITDGNDTAGTSTKEEVLEAVKGARIFAIPVGAEVTVSTLEELVGAQNVLPAADFGQLQASLAQVEARLADLASGEGLYILYYATPKRAGTHWVTISLRENTSTGSNAVIHREFTATNFSSVTPVITRVGPEVVREGTPVVWELRTRWSRETPVYTVTEQDPQGRIEVEELGPTTDGRGIRVQLSATGVSYGSAGISVSDAASTAPVQSFSISAQSGVTPKLSAFGGVGRVVLAWTQVSDASTYRVYARQGAGEEVLLTSTWTQTWAHTGLTEGETWTYQVAAVTSGEEGGTGGEQPRSAQVMATVGIPEVAEVMTGGDFTCGITGGNVRCWGYNAGGLLGTASSNYSLYRPEGIAGLDGVVQLATGDNHLCALRTDGTVWCWGNNLYGQVGLGTGSTVLRPAKVEALTGVVEITAGNHFSCALLSDGTVQCWGYNMQGQLGDGTNGNRHQPAQVSGLSGAVQVSAGIAHACAVLGDGGVRCWGSNTYGRLGDGSTVASSVPVPVSGITTALQVSAGSEHTCAVLSGGALRCWGLNNYRQLGDGTSTTRTTPVAVSGVGAAAQVSAGAAQTCAALTNGSTWCWPSNMVGAIGCGSACPADGYAPGAIQGLSGTTQVSLSNTGHACARMGAEVRCWGSNSYGELGNGSTGYASTPVAPAW